MPTEPEVEETVTEETTTEEPIAESPKNVAVKGRILVAEDTQDIRELMALHLQELDVEFEFAENGKEAIDKIIAKQFDLIFLDNHMPIMGGKEALRVLRQSGCDLPIFFLSASAMKSEMQEFVDSGANGAISKPVDRELLFKVIKECLDADYEEQNHALVAKRIGMFQNMRLKYLNKLPKEIHNLNASCESRDLSEIREITHRVAGTSGSFGFNDIMDVARQINLEAKADNLEVIPGLISELTNYQKQHSDSLNDGHSEDDNASENKGYLNAG